MRQERTLLGGWLQRTASDSITEKKKPLEKNGSYVLLKVVVYADDDHDTA